MGLQRVRHNWTTSVTHSNIKHNSKSILFWYVFHFYFFPSCSEQLINRNHIWVFGRIQSARTFIFPYTYIYCCSLASILFSSFNKFVIGLCSYPVMLFKEALKLWLICSMWNSFSILTSCHNWKAAQLHNVKNQYFLRSHFQSLSLCHIWVSVSKKA